MRWTWPWAPVSIELQARAGIPLFATFSAFGYGLALAFTTRSLFSTAVFGWWFFVFLALTAVTGVMGPMVRESNGVHVGRFVLGLVWLLLPAVIGSLTAVAQGGWSVDELLAHGVIPGALLLASFVQASSLGDGCVYLVPTGEPDTAAQVRVEARRALRGFQQLAVSAFKSWLLLALLGTGILEGLLHLGVGQIRWLGLAMGAVLGLGGMLVALAFAYLYYKTAALQVNGEDEPTVVKQPAWPTVLPLVGIVTLGAWLLPRDVSPIARYGLYGLFQRVSEIVGPWFIAGQRRQAPSRDGFLSRMVRRLLPGLETGGESVAEESVLTALGNAFLLTLAVVAAALILWRFISIMRRRDLPEGTGPGYGGRGLLIQFFSWLWESLRSLFQALGEWTGAVAPARERKAASKERRARRMRRRKESRQLGPAERIQQLFARWLGQMERLGYPRQRTETPFEYAGRVARLRPDVRSELHETVNIYVEARYSPEQEISFLERAYLALRASIAEVVQLIRRKSADPR